MKEHKIGEVFLDTESFKEPKKVKSVRFTTCKSCIYQGFHGCQDRVCIGVHFIETDEPLTTE